MSKPKPKQSVPAKTDADRNRKLYLIRLQEHDIPANPLVPQLRPARQFQLAHLAATLAASAGDHRSLNELAGRAAQLWSAAGNALYVERQAQVLVRGLLVLDRKDWQTHCGALIASLNDMEGAQPGQNPTEVIRKSYVTARAKAAAAVDRVCRGSVARNDVLRGLFPGKSETDKSRRAKFGKLCAFAKETIERGHCIPLGTADADPVSAALHYAWEPLGLPAVDVLQKALTQAKALIEDSDTALQGLDSLNPCVARWFAIVRQEQASQAKARL